MKTKVKSGFTIVEMLVGLIAASILALTAGAVLRNVYLGWGRSLLVADLERNAAVAVHALNVGVRGASQVLAPPPSSQLRVVIPENGSLRTNIFLADSTTRSLSFNNMMMVSNCLDTFSVTTTGNTVWISMTLSAMDENNQPTGIVIAMTNLCLFTRNKP